MEVHHHAHLSNTVESHSKNKNWAHYFWEFLMLFLAVFAGFLAENQREHIVEHRRARVYASNLYKELQKDTANLNMTIPWTEKLIQRFDTICSLSQAEPPVSNGQMYFYTSYTSWIRIFSSEATTMEQLKNSGNLRIMKTDIALKVSEYERRLQGIENDYNLFRTEYEIMNGLRLKIFDGLVSYEISGGVTITKRDDPGFRDSVFHLKSPLINNDPKLMKEFVGWVKSESDFWQANIKDHLKPINETALEILALLKKEYDLN
jgi:hypothetical protein